MHDLDRFLHAQEGVYSRALGELKDGHKRSHWMWFIFPQIVGLGHSSTAQHYAVKSAAEARAYLAHPVLGARLQECTEAVVAVTGRSALAIFGGIDELKFRSSMTLFGQMAEPGSVYAQALDRYFEGEPDQRTLDILARLAPGED